MKRDDRRNPADDSPTPTGQAQLHVKNLEQAQRPTSGQSADEKRPKEIGGPTGPEPTRYGDWERNGRCSDF